MSRKTVVLLVFAFASTTQHVFGDEGWGPNVSQVGWIGDSLGNLVGRPDRCESCPPRTLFAWPGTDCYSSSASTLCEPLASDRPQFTESVWTVGRGVGQVELGYLYTFDDEAAGSVRSNQIPMLLRYGVFADWLEFRIGATYFDTRTAPAAAARFTQSGSSDLVTGFKIALTPQDAWRPELAMLAQLSLPTGSTPASDDDIFAHVGGIYRWQLTECLAFKASTQGRGARDIVTRRAFVEVGQSAVLEARLTDNIEGFAEWLALFTEIGGANVDLHQANFGVKYHLTNDWQWDVHAATGLNTAAVDYLVGTGLVARF